MRLGEQREVNTVNMTRNGHGPPGGLAVMPATAPERAGKVVYGDGSWQLTIFVTDLQVEIVDDKKRVNCKLLLFQVERSLRVRGDLHIGGVMIQLVDSLGNTPQPQRATCSAVESSERNAKPCEKSSSSVK